MDESTALTSYQESSLRLLGVTGARPARGAALTNSKGVRLRKWILETLEKFSVGRGFIAFGGYQVSRKGNG